MSSAVKSDASRGQRVRRDSAGGRPGRRLRQLRAGCHLLLALRRPGSAFNRGYHGDGEAFCCQPGVLRVPPQHLVACPPPVPLRLCNKLKSRITALPAPLRDDLLLPAALELSATCCMSFTCGTNTSCMLGVNANPQQGDGHGTVYVQ